ncbi:hypothetical protein HanIR_Chr17g0875841 [Helianthus annuus]|nr:hypothetical protein HanIR_Chr17g0875841 [Helianthus annuus]
MSRREDWDILECTLANHVLETTSQSHIKLAMHKDFQVAFQNYGTVGIGEPCGFEYLVGVRFLEVLALFASAMH